MAKTQIKNYVFKPGIGALDNLYPNAYGLLESNKSFIQKEATAWIQSQVDAGESGFVGYTYNQEKCERDVGFIIDAYLYDLRYGGNSRTYKYVSYYWDQDVAQVDGDRQPEIQTHAFIRDLITDYIFTNTLYSAENLSETQVITDTDAETAAEARIDTLSGIVIDVITNGLSSLPTLEPTGVGTIKIQGRYDPEDFLLITNVTKNEIVYNFSNPTTGGTVEFKTDNTSDDADFSKYLQVTDAITTITLNYNTSSHSSTDELQLFVEQVENGKSVVTTRPYDFGTDAIERMRVAQPLSMLDADFEYGLQPTKWAAIGTLRGYPSVYEVPGTDTPVLSVVSDASFGNTTQTFELVETAGSTLNFEAGEDRTGPISGQVSSITIVEGDTISITSQNTTTATALYLKTVLAGSTGQNLVEGATGQGARVGGTDTVLAWTPELGDAGTYFITDANNTPSVELIVLEGDADSGVGQSLITITTVSPHGFVVGTPVTVKALEDSVLGASRAEGSFVIESVPEPNQITYFAKSKVGSIPGTVLSTTYTQLRQGGFYTGANIGQPDITVLSNGSDGTMTTQLQVPSSSTLIPFDGTAPEIGSPLDHPLIPTGSQVTNIISQSQGGGTFLTSTTTSNVLSGTNSISVSSVVGIEPGLAVDRGDGQAIFITDIDGTTLEFSDNFTSNIIGNQVLYSGIGGDNQSSFGVDANFDISIVGTDYIIDAINDPGSNYEIGDRILITGDKLGGLTPENDAVVTVEEVASANEISVAVIEGTPFDGTFSLSGVTANYTGGLGDSASFDVEYLDGSYTDVTVNSAGQNYIVNDVIVIPGSAVNFTNGVDGFNDLYIQITSVGASGEVTGVSFTGQAPNFSDSYTAVPFTTDGAGSGATVNVSFSGGTYTVDIPVGGIDFLPDDTITVTGDNLGGATTDNDLIITVTTVDGSGAITDFSTSGTAFNGDSPVNLVGDNRVGSGATFDIDLAAGSYSVTLVTPGTGYAAGQELLVSGDLLAGSSPANDLTITVDTVTDLETGLVETILSSGAGATPGGPFLAVEGVNQQNTGTGATFNVQRDSGTYSLVSVNTGGSGYRVGNRINISGTVLDGATPVNDILLRVITISGGGESGPINSVAVESDSASVGNEFNLICTVTMTEATTDVIPLDASITFSALATLQIEFDSAHGLVPGNTFIVTIGSDDGENNHSIAGGSFFATDIPTVTTLTYQARTVGAIDTSTPIQSIVYPRPDSFFIHRPFDGGVQLGTGGPQHGAQAIRQSKKYIRYQSGKGIMYTTGALFAPSYDLRSVTAEDVEVGSLITIVTDDNDHGVQVGGTVRLLGIETPGYNSGPETAVPPRFDYEVEEVVNERTFKIRAQRRLGSTNAVLGFAAQMSVVSWHGATVRSGIFDDQNGIFWEFDGTQISVVQRTGTQQLAGTIAMTVDTNLVTGTNTRFRDQLKAGDKIIIKGMTHVVSHVNSQTECTVTPDWRGVVNITGAKANLIVDKKVKQSDFNLDRLDGTGPSGYEIDIAKMQMIGIQYSWYGAGFIDFMLRGANGNFVFAHRMRNSNVNTEAFMRSGNLPVRYEVTNEGPPGKLAEAMDDTQTYMVLEDTSFFPTSGTVYIDNEIIRFTGKDDALNRLTGLTRSATFTNFQAGAARSYTASAATAHNDRTGVVLISQTITPLISHWGSAFITDGMFDEDRGYIFSYAETGVTVSTTKQTAFLIRLAPSVSNALVGDLGERELLNRAQLLLQGLEITSDTGTGGIVIEGILNPQNYPLNPNDIGWSELSGVAQGGQPSFAQIASGGSVVWSTGEAATTADITAQAKVTKSLTQSVFNDDRRIRIFASELQSVFGTTDPNIIVGETIENAKLPTGTTIRRYAFQSFSGGQLYYGYDLSRQANDRINVGETVNIVKGGNETNRNFGFFTKASVDTAGATIGTQVTGGSAVTFPSNTLINNVELIDFGGTEFYEIQFNNSYSGTLVAGTGTVELTFSQPPFAQPGETVFSFIATPGERSTLDLSELKELTNTPLGGRGTYPNGPDVLAINVYKVTGADVDSNIIIRWGEAQA